MCCNTSSCTHFHLIQYHLYIKRCIGYININQQKLCKCWKKGLICENFCYKFTSLSFYEIAYKVLMQRITVITMLTKTCHSWDSVERSAPQNKSRKQTKNAGERSLLVIFEEQRKKKSPEKEDNFFMASDMYWCLVKVDICIFLFAFFLYEMIFVSFCGIIKI